jgi:hypothetical protein
MILDVVLQEIFAMGILLIIAPRILMDALGEVINLSAKYGRCVTEVVVFAQMTQDVVLQEDFCDGNTPYNCTSDINGCLRRSNKSECEIWQVCDGGSCVCSNDAGCSSVGDFFCDGNIPYNCTPDINGCFRRSNQSECGDACFNGDCIFGINCGTLIDESGIYFLTSNISLQEDLTCIGILSDDVNFNCLGNSIDGNGTNNTAIYIMGF